MPLAPIDLWELLLETTGSVDEIIEVLETNWRLNELRAATRRNSSQKPEDCDRGRLIPFPPRLR